MSIVGRAYVTVRAVTRQVPGDIQGGVDNALSKLDVSGGDKAGDKLGKEIGKGIEGSGVDKSVAASLDSPEIDKAGDTAGDRVGKAMKAKLKTHTTEAFRDMERDSARSGRGIGDELGDAISHSLFDGGRFDGIWKKILPDGDGEREGERSGNSAGSGFVKGFTGAVPTLLISSIILPMVQEGIPAISALTAEATSLASTLGPTLAAGAGVGANAVAGLLTTVGALTLAFKTNTDEVASLVAGLGPAREEWTQTGAAIQNVLFPALEGAGNRLTAALGPTLRSGLVDTASAVAGVVGQLTRLSETTSFQERLGRILDNNAISVANFGSAGVHTVDMLTSLAAAASPLTVRFSSWVDQLTAGTAKSLAAAEATGQLDDWFNRAGDTAAKWGDILGNVGSALGRVFSIGMDSGGRLLDSLDAITQRFEDWTKSFDGQNAIAEWFARGQRLAGPFADAIGGVVKGLDNFVGSGDNTASILESIAGILPNVGTFLNAFSTSLTGVLRTLEPVSAALANLAPQWTETGNAIWQNLGPAIDRVLPPLQDLIDAALQVVEAFAPAAGPISAIASVLLHVLAPALEGVATVLDALPNSVVGVVGALLVLKLAFNQLTASATLGPMVASFTGGLSTIRAEMAATSGAAASMRVGIGSAVSAIGGPITVAIAAATVGIGLWAQKNAEAEARVSELTSTLNDQTGAITENTRASVANSLEKAGALEQAQQLGLSLQTVTDAALGNKNAIGEVNTTLARYVDFNKSSLVGGWDDMPGVVKTLFTFTGAVDDNEAAAIGLHKTLNTTTGDLKAAQSGFDRVAEATGHAKVNTTDFNRTYASAEDVVGRFGRTLDGTKSSTAGAAAAQRSLTAATIAYQAAVAKSIGGTIGLEQAIDDAKKAMDQNRHTLNLNTQAGRDNMSALLDIANAAGKVTGSADKQQAAMERARAKIIAYAEGMGAGADKANALADRLLHVKDSADKIPGNYVANVDAKTEGAQSAISTLRTTLNDLTSHPWSFFVGGTVRTTYQRIYTGGGGQEAPDPALAAAGKAISRGVGAGPGGAALGGTRGGPSAAAGVMTSTTGASTSPRAQARVPQGGTLVQHNETINYNVTVMNPTQERTSDSIPRSLRRARDLGIIRNGGRDDR